MLATSPTIPVPTYEPAPYALTGRAFKSLPPLARYFLADVVGVTDPKAAGPQLIKDHRDALKCTFFRALQGNDEWLVREWRAIQKWRSLAAQGMEARGLSESEEQFLVILLPEREGLFREFVAKFDALIWLELEGLKGDSALTGAQQRRYRDEKCGLKEALEYPRKALEALDRQVSEMLEDKFSSPVKTFFERNVYPAAVPRAVTTRRGDCETTRSRVNSNWRRPQSPEEHRRTQSHVRGPISATPSRRWAMRAERPLEK